MRIGSMFTGVGGLDLAVLALFPDSSIAWHYVSRSPADTDGAGQQGPVRAGTRGGTEPPRPAAPDTGGDGLVRSSEQDLGTHRPGQQAPQRDHVDGLDVGDHRTDWGGYAPAIHRWERILGRPVPAPVDDAGRLNPDFVEWMMGWPARWTDVPGATRGKRLKECGNGVVTLQAYVAYSQLMSELRDVIDAATWECCGLVPREVPA